MHFNQKTNFLINEYVKEILNLIYLRKFSQHATKANETSSQKELEV